MFFSKHNMGIVLTLLLILLLSQSKILNMFVNTALGRTILIGLLVFLSYIHKILGVILVLIIIILINNNDNIYLEGFTNSNNTTSQMTNLTDTKKPKGDTQPLTMPTSNTKITNTKIKSQNVAQEGFDIIGTEHNLKKGKQSNSISVNTLMKGSDNVLPNESASFSSVSSTY